MEVLDGTWEELDEAGNETLSDDKISEWGGIEGSIAEDDGETPTLVSASDETPMAGNNVDIHA
jgi:hypothetical protein